MEKQINQLHLIYGYIITGIIIVSIIICWILSCEGIVSETAFQNFSFAASVVSIVLAVVSIVFTIYSGANVSNSVGVLQEAEKNIETQVEALNGLESRIIKSVENSNNAVSEKISAVQNQIEPLIRTNFNANTIVTQTPVNNSEIKIDLSANSVYGNILLYICLKSAELNQSWPLDILGSENVLYFLGYLVAMASIPSMHFSYTSDKEITKIMSCTFTSTDILKLKENVLKELKLRPKQSKSEEMIKLIDDYFEKNVQ
ncbi:MAG: hypothetical protein J6A35_03235 [Paludibacteraceae bacterium]|nr:hypothetical protein [Paludibacteraceae bacterium]